MQSSLIKQIGLLLFCAGGIYASYLTQGVLQERLALKTYGPSSIRLPHISSLNGIQSLVCFAWSSLLLLLLKSSRVSKSQNVAPKLSYWLAGLTNSVGPACGFQALKNISYPAQVLAKSCKMVPVMIMGTLVGGRKYSKLDYLCAAFIAGGISLFASRSSVKVATKLANPNIPLGYSLCLLNLLFDGYTNAKQDELHRKFKDTNAVWSMAWMNFWSGSFYSIYLFGLTSAGAELLQFCQVHPQAMWDILAFCCCGAIGEGNKRLRTNKEEKSVLDRLFPCDDFCRWLTYGNDLKIPKADSSYFKRREFSFTLEGDVFVRYQSFKDSEALRLALVKKLPTKMDLGPVYSYEPNKRSAYIGSSQSAFYPLERELVFDIDISDYDDVRTCGSNAHICEKCWPLMAIAIQVLNDCLRTYFGYKHILFVFSGRRGVHCWVADKRARLLTDEQRSSLANFFSIYKGVEHGRTRLSTHSHSQNGIHFHPSVDFALKRIANVWIECVLTPQKLLSDPKNFSKILHFFGGDNLADLMSDKWASETVLIQDDHSKHLEVNKLRWTELQDAVAKIAKGKDARRGQHLQRCMKEILLGCAYPRLDVEVSKKMNHLLKAPFCIHPGTGMVCVPIDPKDAFAFVPSEAPMLQSLVEELSIIWQNKPSNQDNAQMWAETKLKKHVEFFIDKFLSPLMIACREDMEGIVKKLAAIDAAW